MPEVSPSKYMVNAGWDDIPHLDEKMKEELLSSYPAHEQVARTKGIPSLGSGAIYPYDIDELKVAPFKIPDFWKRAYGLDVGWNRTAAIWGARDPDSDIIYLYAEHYLSHQMPSVHATAIKARGEWITGAIDPAARGRSQDDGTQLFQDYIDLGLKIVPADNSVDAGIFQVAERYGTGRMKIFTTLVNLIAEQQIYRRDEKGKIVKKNDHAMDALRYLVVTGMDHASYAPFKRSASQYAGAADTRANY